MQYRLRCRSALERSSPRPNEDARAENDGAAQGNLHRRGERGRFHEPMPHPCDYTEFHDHHGYRNSHGERESAGEKWQRVSDAAERRHAAADEAAQQRMPAPGERAVVGKRLRETHADSGSERGRQSDEKSRVRGVRGKSGGNTGASVETEPSISPANPGLE